MHTKQSGSFHAVLIVIVGVVLVGAIGFLFYQNILLKEKVNETPAASQAKAEAEILKKEYCAEKEKLCFTYPENWTVRQIEDANTTSADNFSVKSPDGTVEMQFMSGIGGTSICCGPMPEGPVTVVSADKVSGGLKVGESEYLRERVHDVYVSTIVTSDVETEYTDSTNLASGTDVINGYIPQVVLHNAKRLTLPGTFNETLGGVALDNLMQGKNAAIYASDPNNKGTFLFGTVTLDDSTDPKIYKTLDEAKKQLISKNFLDAKKILLSAHY